MIYELRLYSVVPGRMPSLLDRFQHHLPAIFARHSIRNVGRWVATVGASGPLFAYMISYESLAEREAQFGAFYADEEWWRVRAETSAGSEVVERFDLHFLRTHPTLHPDPAMPDERLGGVQELLFVEVKAGHGTDAGRYLSETYLPAVERAGGRLMIVSDFICGPNMPRMAMMIGWPCADAQHAGRLAIDADEQVLIAQKKERDAMERPSILRTDIMVLEPTAFDLPLAALGFHAG